MKIFYAIQATGNGHISRAHQLLPYLKELGAVDFLLSGSNSTLAVDFPIKYKSPGLSLFYDTCGTLHYTNTVRKIKHSQVYGDIKNLPLEEYDLIINDFDFITAYACKLKKLPSVQFGHQASFQSNKTPRPDKKSRLGEMILKHYAPASNYVGLHFESYDDFIHPPIIKQQIIESKPEDHGHISVYLPAYQRHCIESILKELAPFEVHWFLPDLKEAKKEDNIHYYPVRQGEFNESLRTCHGLITGGGFETPAEALYMHKKLISIPIGGQYEQLCNAAALKKLGVSTLNELTDKTKAIVHQWLLSENTHKSIQANNIPNTLVQVMKAVR